MKLTSEQLGPYHDNGNTLVIACPGSGKTKLIVSKAVRLVDEGLNAVHIVTFTKESALELQHRIDSQGEFYKRRIYCSTLHSICQKHLRKYCSQTKLVTPEEQHTHLLNAWNQNELDVKSHNAQARAEAMKKKQSCSAVCLSDFEKYVEMRVSRPDYKIDSDNREDTLLNKIYVSYCEFIAKEKFSSLTSIIQTTVDCIQNESDFPLLPTEHLMLDEAQDADWPQFMFIALHTANGIPTTVVGDDDQGLYSFRFAMGTELFKRFMNLANVKAYTLTQNFRSKSEIVTACSALIAHNKNRINKAINPVQAGGGKLTAIRYANENEQIAEIVQMLRDDTSSSSIAVLSRTNRELDSLEQALSCAGIAYRRTDSKGYFETSVCKQYLALLQAFSNSEPRRMAAALQPLIGSKEAAQLLSNCVIQHTTPSGSIIKGKVKFSKSLVTALSYAYTNIADKALKSITPLFIDTLNQKGVRHNEVERVAQLCDILLRLKGPLRERLAVLTIEKEASQHRINLMSSHGSKGCEFETVYIINANDNMYPYVKDDDERAYIDIIEEERRLFFVSMSRAINNLYVCVSKPDNPSRFISEAELNIQDKTYLQDMSV